MPLVPPDESSRSPAPRIVFPSRHTPTAVFDARHGQRHWAQTGFASREMHTNFAGVMEILCRLGCRCLPCDEQALREPLARARLLVVPPPTGCYNVRKEAWAAQADSLFTPEEIGEILGFLRRGGRLFLSAYRFGDSFTKTNLRELITPLGCLLNEDVVIDLHTLRVAHPLQSHFETPRDMFAPGLVAGWRGHGALAGHVHVHDPAGHERMAVGPVAGRKLHQFQSRPPSDQLRLAAHRRSRSAWPGPVRARWWSACLRDWQLWAAANGRQCSLPTECAALAPGRPTGHFRTYRGSAIARRRGARALPNREPGHRPEDCGLRRTSVAHERRAQSAEPSEVVALIFSLLRRGKMWSRPMGGTRSALKRPDRLLVAGRTTNWSFAYTPGKNLIPTPSGTKSTATFELS